MTVPGSLYTPTIRKTRGVSLVEIENSALFDDDNAEYLHRDNTSAQTDTKKFTYSTWINRGAITGGTNCALLSGGSGTTSGRTDFLFTAGSATGDGSNNDALKFDIYTGSWTQRRTLAKLRDASGWYHIVLVYDAANGTANDTLIIYLNGNRLDLDSAAGVPNNLSLINANGQRTRIGADGSNTPVEFDGYMAETVMIDGQALTPSSFGEFDTTGNYWTPKSSTDIKNLTFGTNGYYLDNTTNAQTDASGNGNNFTNNNTVLTSTHTPTNQACLMNPLYPEAGTLERGNRTGVTDGVDGAAPVGTLFFDAEDTDGYYFEGKPTTGGSIGAFLPVGICTAGHVSDHPTNDAVDARSFFFAGNGGIQNTSYISNATWDAYSNGSGAINDIYQMVIKGGNIYFGINNTWYDSSDDTFANAGTAFTGVTGFYTPCFQLAAAATGKVEFSFLDADFTYSRPSTTKEITTTNIAEATTRTVSDPYEHWNNILYTGNGTAIGSGGQAITGAGFQPDFGWIKGRSGATEHVLTDIVRGVTKELSSNDTGTEETVAEGLTAFGSDGFTVGSDGSYNTSSATYVAWLAKLGGTAVSNTDGTITSSVSVNTTLGMSVGTYTSTNGGGAGTIGHGLGVVPQMIIVKNAGSADNWAVYHSGTAADAETDYLMLNTTAAAADLNTMWNDTAPTSSVLSVGTSGSTNDQGNALTHMFMAFAPSEYISIGSYAANANADGPLSVTLNSLGIPLMPIWMMIKTSSHAGSWGIYDGSRDPENEVLQMLLANATNTEATASSEGLDFVSGGIKQRDGSGSSWNLSGYTYIHLTIGIPTIDVDGRLLTAR